jgi:type I restriction enzyme M protein
LGTIGLDNEVDRQAVGGPRLGRPDDGHQCSSSSNQACGPLLDVGADDNTLPATLVGNWCEQGGNREKPFPTFASLLAKRGTLEAESDFSWTVDFIARRGKAREEMAPYIAGVERLKAETVALKDKITALKKAAFTEREVGAIREKLSAVERAARESQATADAIDAATYDLKAVNPRARIEQDTRTPTQILDAIAHHGQTVNAALEQLRELIRPAIEAELAKK